MDPTVIDFFGSVLVMGVIYFCSSGVRNWIKRLNGYDPMLQKPEYSSHARFGALFLFWFVSFMLFLGGKSILGKVLNIDSWNIFNI